MPAKKCIYQNEMQELLDFFNFNLKAPAKCIKPNDHCYNCKYSRLHSYLKRAQMDVDHIELLAHSLCKERLRNDNAI